MIRVRQGANEHKACGGCEQKGVGDEEKNRKDKCGTNRNAKCTPETNTMKCSIRTAPGEEQRQQPLATIVLTIVAFTSMQILST